ncbi:MAG: hypothetical protein KA436_08455 [Oligoflexales bacterium]|nr:hypothetical protein [Oligoflexales bacterium]
MQKVFMIILLLISGVVLALFLRYPKEKAELTHQTSSKPDENRILNEPAPPPTPQTATAPQGSLATSHVNSAKEALVAGALKSSNAPQEFSRVGLSISRLLQKIEEKEQKDLDFAKRFSPQIFENNYKRKLADKFTEDELLQLNKLHQQKEMTDYVQTQEKFFSEEGRKTINDSFVNYDQNPPPTDRLRLLEDLNTTAHLSEYNATTMKVLNDTIVEIAKKGSTIDIRPEIFKRSALVQLTTTLAGKSDSEIHTITQTLTSPVKQKELAIRQEAIIETLQNQ